MIASAIVHKPTYYIYKCTWYMYIHTCAWTIFSVYGHTAHSAVAGKRLCDHAPKLCLFSSFCCTLQHINKMAFIAMNRRMWRTKPKRVNRVAQIWFKWQCQWHKYCWCRKHIFTIDINNIYICIYNVYIYYWYLQMKVKFLSIEIAPVAIELCKMHVLRWAKN